jgi:hypothetical protein
MLAEVAQPLRFDGQDLTDVRNDDEVMGYALVVCPGCGTERDPRYPFCCGLGVEPRSITPTSSSAHP